MHNNMTLLPRGNGVTPCFLHMRIALLTSDALGYSKQLDHVSFSPFFSYLLNLYYPKTQ